MNNKLPIDKSRPAWKPGETKAVAEKARGANAAADNNVIDEVHERAEAITEVLKRIMDPLHVPGRHH